MVRILLILYLFLVAGCRSKPGYDFQSYKFDPQIAARLPLYDSLSHLLLQDFSSLRADIKADNSFSYERSLGNGILYKKMSSDAAEKISSYITQLGENFIAGFDVYKDSTIRYLVRETYLKPYYLTIREHLSFFPNGGKMRQSEPPNKDTILNKNWQYWIRFDEREIF